MAVTELLIASSMPVLKVLLVTSVGSLLATTYVDVLGPDARKHLNNVVFYVFNPSLVATNLGKTITYQSMMKMCFMPVNIFLTYIIGSALGWIVIHITKAPSHLKGLILGCSSAGNLGHMLFIIIPTICKEKGSPFGSPHVCNIYGMAYASLSMAVGAMFLWSYVYNVVRIYSTTKKEQTNGAAPEIGLPEESLNLLPTNYTTDLALMKDTFSKKVKYVSDKISVSIDFKKLIAPSTIGVIIGFAIGVIPQLRRCLIGETAPLRVIQDSAALLADGAIPTVTLIMGANLLKGLRSSDVTLSVIIGVVAVRYIALPLLGIIMVKVAIHLGLVHSDPLYQFVLLIQYALPPAINIGTITQLFGAGESECSVILLWAYSLASISLTVWSTLFLWLVS